MGKAQVEAVRLLLSFVRRIGLHKDDLETYGKEKWMTAEEALYYDYLDCDDYTTLFYYLVKELLHLPLIIISYPDFGHVNIGVAFKENIGNQIMHKKKKYTVCDPTGPVDDEGVGENDLLLKWKYTIVGEYHPE